MNFFTKKQHKLKSKPVLTEDKFRLEYSDHFLDDELGYKKILKENDLENYLKESIQRRVLFTESLIVNAGCLQEEFSRFLYSKYNNYDWVVASIYSLKINDPKQLLNFVLEKIDILYSLYKEFLVGLAQFYLENEGFEWPLAWYPKDMISEPFFQYFKNMENFESFDRSIYELFYMQLIKRIVKSRFLIFSNEENERVRENLSYFINRDKSLISKLARSTRDKLLRYNGQKSPGNVVYLSKIKYEQSVDLSDFIVGRFLENDTDKFVLSRLFQGLNGTVSEEEYKLDFYKKNDLLSAPFKIKKGKLGYISFIFKFLDDNKLINCENLWSSLAKHECFIKNNGKYVSSNDLSRALNYKNERQIKIEFQREEIREKIQDKDLQELKTFLNKTFLKKSK